MLDGTLNRTARIVLGAMIYFVYPQLYKLSGAERLILGLATSLTQLGAPVTLVTHYFDAVCAPARGANVRLIQTGNRVQVARNHYRNAPFEYLAALRLVRYLGADASAVTFFGPPSLPALTWARRARKTRAPLLYFCYEPPRFIYDDTAQVTARIGRGGALARPLFGIYKQLDRAMARRADVLLANSHFGAARLQAAYGRAASVITHGADFASPLPDRARALRSRYGSDDEVIFLTVNFLHPRKRIDLFLRALSELRQTAPKAVGLVVGAGPERDALHALAHALGLKQAVHWAGFVPDADLPAYYAAADVYLHTGRAESFGLSVLEASAAGLPVIAVDEGGPREILQQNETGLLVAATPAALARAAHELARDPARRRQMGAAGKRRVSVLYSWQRGAQDFLGALAAVRPGAAPAAAAQQARNG